MFPKDQSEDPRFILEQNDYDFPLTLKHCIYFIPPSQHRPRLKRCKII